MQELSVIGAGLVGSLLSVYLGDRGHKVLVYDRRPDFRLSGAGGGRSINLALSERGLSALEGAGLREAALKLCLPMHGRMIHDLDGAQHFQPYGKEGQFIRSVSRSGLNLLMMEAADAHPKVDFFFEQACQGMDPNSGELWMLDEGAGKSYSLQPQVVFGTDGAFSALRYSLQRRPLFNYQQDYLAHGYKELSIPPAADGGWRMDPEALHIWPRQRFMLIALPNLDGSFTCTLFAPFEGEEGFSACADEASLLRYFDRHFADAKELMPHLQEEFFSNPTSSLVTIRCYPWAFGNSLLLGDAAHAIVPFYGQGMNAGFEDCRVLGQLMDDYGQDWSNIFERFQQERKPNADAIAELAKRNFIEMRDKVADPRFLLQKKIANTVADRHPGQFSPVYSLVSFSHTPYSSALTEMDRQQAIFDRIFEWPELEQRWEKDYLEQIEGLLLGKTSAESK